MKQLSLEEKQTVQTQLQAYVSKYPSQNKAVNSLGLSTGTVSAILNGKFDNISDEMFLRIRSLVSPINPEEWAVCETTAYRELSLLLSDAQANQNVSWVVGNAGIGKTTTAHDCSSSRARRTCGAGTSFAKWPASSASSSPRRACGRNSKP